MCSFATKSITTLSQRAVAGARRRIADQPADRSTQKREQAEALSARDRLGLVQQVAREHDAAAGRREVEAAPVLGKTQAAAVEPVVEIDAEREAARAQVATRLLEAGEMEERFKAIETALGPRIGGPIEIRRR